MKNNMKQTSTNAVAAWVRRVSLAAALLCFAVAAYAQQRVTGTVTDAELTTFR